MAGSAYPLTRYTMEKPTKVATPFTHQSPSSTPIDVSSYLKLAISRYWCTNNEFFRGPKMFLALSTTFFVSEKF